MTVLNTDQIFLKVLELNRMGSFYPKKWSNSVSESVNLGYVDFDLNFHCCQLIYYVSYNIRLIVTSHESIITRYSFIVEYHFYD